MTSVNAPKNILVVDNDPFFLTLFSEFLGDEGHHVTCVDDAFQCLAHIRDHSPEIIFLDLIMPFLGGDDLCRIIRQQKRFSKTIIVVVSAVALEQPVDIYALGADACIAKGPYSLMRENIRKVMAEAANPAREHALQQACGYDQIYPREITRELLDRTDHLRAILDKMSQGIIEIAEERVMYINSSGAEMLHASRQQVVGLETAAVLPATLLEVLNTGGREDGHSWHEAVRRQVQFNEHQFLVERLHLCDKYRGALLILSDITERKRMESVIEAANLTENLGYVFSGIRHEIGNPVNSIKMALSVLQRNLGEYDRDTIAEFLERSLTEIGRIEYLLKALKNYSLFESPVVQDLRLSAFLKDFNSLVRSDFEQQNIRISTVLADDELVVRADSRALHHVLLNLLTNSAHALVAVEKPRIAISCYQKGEMVVIKVDDNGKGIAKDDLEHLFKPFFTSKTTGTGLGLVIVRKMLTAMHGFISIESYQGVGTTATIVLPGGSHDGDRQEASSHHR